MKLPRYSDAAASSARPSFTLVEMLVVMGIISILVSLSAAAIIKAIGAQQNSNAKTTIKRLDAAREERWKAAVDVAYRNSNNMAAIDPNNTGSWYALTGSAPWNNPQSPQLTITNMAGTDPNHVKRARAIYVAYFMKQQFPQSFAEVLNCNKSLDPRWLNPLGANPEFVKKLTTLGIVANDPPLPGESTALLYMALEKGNNGAGKVSDLFGSNSVKGQMFPTSNGQVELPIFKDEWATPYEFFRWTTFNPTLDVALPPASKSRNVLDPDNTFMNAAWFNLNYAPKVLPFGYTSPRLLFEQTCYSLRAGYAYPAAAAAQDVPYTYYITPVVVTAGKDTVLGLSLPGTSTPMLDAGTGASYDNIYSYMIKRE